MSQGKKIVTVLDTETCIQREIAVDESRYNFLLQEFTAKCKSSLIDPYMRANDAAEGVAFLVSQLAYTEAQTYDREYQDVQFRDLIPTTSEAGPEAATVRYQVYDRVGQGKRINADAKDMPYSDASAAQVEMAVVDGGMGYRYNQIELLQAAKMIRALPAERMEASVEGAERHLNQVAMLGEAPTTTAVGPMFTGLLSQAISQSSNAGQYITNSTSGINAAWANAGSTSFDKVLADVNFGILQFWKNSNYTLFPDTFGMAPTCFTPLATRYNTLGTKTLLQLLEEQNLMTAKTGKPMNFVPIYLADTAGASGTPRCVLYCNDKKRLVFHVPMAHRFLAPQPEGLAVQVPGWYRYSGVNLRYGYSMVYMDNMA